MSGELNWFCDTTDGVEYFATQSEAEQRASEVIHEIMILDGEWGEDVERVCWGRVHGRSVARHLTGGLIIGSRT